MAGADRATTNVTTRANSTDYRRAGHETTNGLDSRYGAGQLNIFNNSYRILAGGEQPSAQPGGDDIAPSGFDYSPLGGADTPIPVASYFLPQQARLPCLPRWCAIWTCPAGPIPARASVTSTLPVRGGKSPAHCFLRQPVRQHRKPVRPCLIKQPLRVARDDSRNRRLWGDYASVWRIEPSTAPIPLPATMWLFGTDLTALVAWGWQYRTRWFGSLACSMRTKGG